MKKLVRVLVGALALVGLLSTVKKVDEMLIYNKNVRFVESLKASELVEMVEYAHEYDELVHYNVQREFGFISLENTLSNNILMVSDEKVDMIIKEFKTDLVLASIDLNLIENGGLSK